MRARLVAGLSALIVSVSVDGADAQTTVVPRGQPAAEARALDVERVSEQVVRHVNELRSRNARSPNDVSEALTRAARSFAAFMAQHDRYGHQADGSTPAARVKRQGYDYCMVAENIAYQFNSAGFSEDSLARRLFTGWRESPGHRANMLDPDALETGVGVARSAQTGRYYAVQLFARPASARFEVHVSNRTAQTIAYRLGERSFELPVRSARAHTQCRAEPLVLPGGDEASILPTSHARFDVVLEGSSLRWVRR